MQRLCRRLRPKIHAE